MNDQSHIFDLLGGRLAIGEIVGFADDMAPVIACEGTGRVQGLSLVPLDEASIGRKVAVAELSGPTSSLLIIGVIQDPMTQLRQQQITIEAEEKLVLRCGDSSLTLKEDGRITLRGKQVLSRADGQNRVQGASVQLN